MSQQFPGPPPDPHQPYGYVQYPESSNALLALILSITNFILCPFLAPVAWYMGNKEIEAIDQGRRDPTKRDQANAARILGIIGTILLGIGVLITIGAVVIVLIAVGSG